MKESNEREQTCVDCIHYEACLDWVKAIWDGQAKKIMQEEAKNCGQFTDGETAKRYFAKSCYKNL